jgi:hypothetical protein
MGEIAPGLGEGAEIRKGLHGGEVRGRLIGRRLDIG